MTKKVTYYCIDGHGEVKVEIKDNMYWARCPKCGKHLLLKREEKESDTNDTKN